MIDKYKSLSTNIINNRYDKYSISSTVTQKNERKVIARQIPLSQVQSGFAIILNIDVTVFCQVMYLLTLPLICYQVF